MGIRNLRTLGQIYLTYRCGKSTCEYLPIFLGIETSGICNLRCVMCPHRNNKQPRGLMQFSVFKQVIDEAKGFVYDADLFGGGEPLLHPEIATMVEYARNAGLHVRLHTNATKLDRDMARDLIDARLDFLSFSFDGYDKEQYERVRAYAEYEQTLDNIKTFLGLKKSKDSPYPYTVLQSIEPDGAGSQDVSKKLAFRHQFSSLPLDEFKVIREHNYGGKIRSATVTGAHRYSPCTFPWYAAYVLWDGTIVPCCVDWWGEYALGKVPDDSLAETWNSASMRALRDKLVRRQYREIQICSECDRLWRDRRLGVPFRDVGVLKSFLSRHLLGYPTGRRATR